MPYFEEDQRCPCDDDLPAYCPIHHPLDVTPKEMNEIAAEIRKRCNELRVHHDALEKGGLMPGLTLFSISRWIGARVPGEAQVIATVRIPFGFDMENAWGSWDAQNGEEDFPHWLVETFENVELVIMPGMVIPERKVGN